MDFDEFEGGVYITEEGVEVDFGVLVAEGHHVDEEAEGLCYLFAAAPDHVEGLLRDVAVDGNPS